MEGFPFCTALGVFSLTTEISTGPPNSCSSFSSCAHSDENNFPHQNFPSIVRVSPGFHGGKWRKLQEKCNLQGAPSSLLWHSSEWVKISGCFCFLSKSLRHGEFKIWYCSTVVVALNLSKAVTKKPLKLSKVWWFLSNLQCLFVNLLNSRTRSLLHLLTSVSASFTRSWQEQRPQIFRLCLVNYFEPQPCLDKLRSSVTKTANKFWNGSWVNSLPLKAIILRDFEQLASQVISYLSRTFGKLLSAFIYLFGWVSPWAYKVKGKMHTSEN